MQIQPPRRSSLFLLELIISILFFSLASAVCVRLFVKSHTLEAESIALDHAVTAASSVAEILRSQENGFGQLESLFPLGEANDDTFVIYYDKEWQPCASSDSSYCLVLTTQRKDSFLIGEIEVCDQEASIYTLEIKKYMTKEDTLL